jgi:hypothetical protein
VQNRWKDYGGSVRSNVSISDSWQVKNLSKVILMWLQTVLMVTSCQEIVWFCWFIELAEITGDGEELSVPEMGVKGLQLILTYAKFLPFRSSQISSSTLDWNPSVQVGQGYWLLIGGKEINSGLYLYYIHYFGLGMQSTNGATSLKVRATIYASGLPRWTFPPFPQVHLLYVIIHYV